MEYIIIYICLINLIAFILMGLDKRRAKRGKWRIPENTLWISAVLGGAFGSIIGMKLFHHKTKHKTFTIGMPMVIILHISVISFIYFNK
ncbi:MULTISPECIES: DUF1294 domain-containing protein [Paraliobacillus]|uniref:DUF1294 domain-containing protein n=1 Tax=Paraliobacillus TaxID=200903 RepID=UPI000DD4786A|nr:MULTISPECIES: DUF1294 domain-containing protein [Paraliobacillus]